VKSAVVFQTALRHLLVQPFGLKVMLLCNVVVTPRTGGGGGGFCLGGGWGFVWRAGVGGGGGGGILYCDVV